MQNIDINNYTKVIDYSYKDEHYSVRDNGAILRHQRDGMRKRLNDNVWTFGKVNNTNPYLLISNIRVHRIIATAFHGDPPDPKYVVDHIDTNCRNNRPENLRWLTRLENALKNPVTRKKIEFLCGSIKTFLENPSMLNNLQADPNFSWMRTVTREEAQNCNQRMELWAETRKKPQKTHFPFGYKSSFAKRALKPLQKWEAGIAREPGLDFAKTKWCAQYMWGANVYFPCCPEPFGIDPLNDYFQNLTGDALFAYDDENSFPKLYIHKTLIRTDMSSIIIICKRADDNWSIVGIELNDKLHFIHYYYGSYSDEKEADTAFSNKTVSENLYSGAYGNSWLVE